MKIEKIELILNTGSRYITNDEKSLILDYIEYLKSKNNVVESKNIELVFEIERLHSIIKEVKEYINSLGWNTTIPNIQDNVWGILDKEK